MRKLISVLVLSLIPLGSYSQNLVPDPSFEDTVNLYNIFYHWAFPWHSATDATPDPFYPSAPNGGGLPNAARGYQIPRTGIAFAGFIAQHSNPTDYREYIECELITPLIQGVTYDFSAYVCRPNKTRRATDDIGVYFSTTNVYDQHMSILQYTPQIIYPQGNLISDTLNWLPFSGTYTAQGGEKFITIGNFNTVSNTTSVLIDSITPMISNHVYIYIDDVSVIPSLTQNIDDISSSHVQLITSENLLKISVTQSSKYELLIFDLSGRQISQHKFTDQLETSTSQLPRGMYVYRILDEWTQIKTGKFVLE